MTRMAWIAAAIALLCPAPLRADDRSSKAADALLAGLETGRLQWLKNLEFYSTYEAEMGAARPFKSVKEARFVREGVNIMSTGSLCKRGNLLRSKYEYLEGWQRVDALPGNVARSPGGTLFRHVPRDEVTDGTIYAVYISRHQTGPSPAQTFGDQLNVEGKTPGFPHFLIGWKNPLSFAQDSFNTLFELTLSPRAEGSAAVSRALRRDDNHVVVHLQREAKNESQSRELSFRVGSYGAVLESYRDTSVTTTLTIESEVQFLDFQDCPGGPVASRVLEGIRSRLAGSSEDHFALHKWTSDDLGKRRPTKDDFVITIPQTTTIIGTDKVPPLVDAKRHFDITAIRESDLWGPVHRR